jgi:hypothetical protein
MTSFRLLRHLNTPEGAACLGYRGYTDERSLRYFPGDGLAQRFVRALAKRGAVPMKEVLESFEFFATVRREVRAPQVADLCAGHGLVGALFALYERSVDRVFLVDRKPPPNRLKVMAAAHEVGPWTREKLVERDEPLAECALELGTSVVSVHGCGARTDQAIELGLASGGAIAVMPCCRAHRRSRKSPAVAREVGPDLAIDIDRTYRMEAAGYRVRWAEIPEGITPMNRVLVGRPGG